MFSSLKNRLKKAIGFAGDLEESPKDGVTVEEVVETTAGEEKIIVPVEEEKIEVKVEEKPEEKVADIIEEVQEIKERAIEEEFREIEPISQPKKKKFLKSLKKSMFKKKKAEEIVEPKPDEMFEQPHKIIEKPVEEKIGLLGKLKKGIVEKKLNENDIEPVIEELKRALLENDVALKVAEQICNRVKTDLIEKSVSRSKIQGMIKDSLRNAVVAVMQQQAIDIEKLIESKQEPFLILFFGFNGSGKTTTIAKFAKKYFKYKPVLAAADTFRAASIEQLEKHADNLGVETVKHKYGADSAAVVFDAVKHAKATGSKLVLADTAGRSHANVNLMDELKKNVRVNKPDMKILVLDSLTGNDIYNQSKMFDDAVGVDAIILTKTDVYAKGGAALSAAHTIGKPIIFIGTGQEYDKLESFDAERIADAVLGD
ncbi:MAG: signal recognition particle-docking protein FtsY [Candidatus Aenigmatarchaeota archaeon]